MDTRCFGWEDTWCLSPLTPLDPGNPTMGLDPTAQTTACVEAQEGLTQASGLSGLPTQAPGVAPS